MSNKNTFTVGTGLTSIINYNEFDYTNKLFAILEKDEDKYLPLLFGVPVFILCGFLHSIADAFYISVLPFEFLESNFNVILYNYIGIVIGNFIGCNLVKIIRLKKEYLN